MYLDELIFQWFFALSTQNPLIGSVMVNITNWSSKLFAAIYIMAIVVLLLNKSKKVLPLLLGPAFALIVVQVIRYFYVRPRPFVAFDIESLIPHAANGSLPSMHAVSAFVIAMAIWCVNKNIGKYVLILAVITGMSRVMVGVHYPLDIVTGALLGVLISLFAFKIAKKYALY